MSGENLTGAPLSIAWDKEDGVDYINLRDQNGELIMKVHKKLWNDGGGTEFTPEVRDSIMTHAQKLFG